MTLTPQTLFRLINNFPEHEHSTPLSVHPSDHPTYRIHIIPLDLAQLIQSEDPGEEFFHVEPFPLLNRADLWRSDSWKESLSRRIKNRATARDADPTTPIIERLNHLEEQLKSVLCSQVRLTYYVASAAASIIMRGGLTPDQELFIAALNLPTELLNNIARTKHELQSTNDPNYIAPSTQRGDLPGQSPLGED